MTIHDRILLAANRIVWRTAVAAVILWLISAHQGIS